MVEAVLAPADRVREADEPHSHVVRFGPDKPLRLDAGVDLSPFQIAYQTYGTLNAERTNAVLICHALTGDQHVANVHPVTGKGGWWETMVGPGRPIDTERYFVICPNVIGACMGTLRPGVDQSRDRRAVGPGFSGHHHPRHGARAGDAARSSRHRLAVLGRRRLDGRHAGAAMDRELSRARVLGAADRGGDAPLGAEHRVPRGRPAGDHGRSGMVQGTLFRRAQGSAQRARGRAHGRAHHLSLGRGAAPEVRPPFPGSRQSDVLVRRRFPGGELSAPPGHLVRRALRRQFLSLPHARDGLFRSRRATTTACSPMPGSRARRASA